MKHSSHSRWLQKIESGKQDSVSQRYVLHWRPLYRSDDFSILWTLPSEIRQCDGCVLKLTLIWPNFIGRQRTVSTYFRPIPSDWHLSWTLEIWKFDYCSRFDNTTAACHPKSGQRFRVQKSTRTGSNHFRARNIITNKNQISKRLCDGSMGIPIYQPFIIFGFAPRVTSKGHRI